MPLHRFRKLATIGALAAIVTSGLAACHNALDVNNPKYISEEQLDNSQLIGVLMNSAVGAVQTNYSEFAWFSAIITDEALNATNDYRSGELSQRIVELAQGNIGPYPLLQYSRATADTSAGRIRSLVKNQGDTRLARALIWAGYSYVFLAEFTCTAPLNGGPLVTDDSLERIALARFKEAITDATSSDTGSTKTVSDSLLAFARVGAARASLNLGDKAGAAAYAALVPAAFVVNVDYITSGNTALENTLWSRVSGVNKQLGVHPLMQHLNDPRVRYVTQAVLGHNQLTFLNVPYSPRSWTTFTYNDSTPLQPNSSIEIASGLEARYILAEAQGPNATTLALVNERRAFGKESAVSLSGDSLMAELREQKRRDFFLAARRLGDLRRYKAQNVGDFFPSGPDPTTQWGLYGSATCYIITQDEVNSNPNVAGYVPPATRPPGYSP